MLTEAHKKSCTCGFCQNKGKLAKKFDKVVTAESVVRALLNDDCGTCPEDRRRRISIGAKLEKEHTDDPKEQRKIARTHMRENPEYYPLTPKPKGAKEALRWVT